MPKATDLVQKGSEQGRKTAEGFAKARKSRKEETSVPAAVSSADTPESSAREAAASKSAVGRPPGTRTAQLTLLMDPVLKKTLQMDALDRGVSAAHIVDEVLRRYYQERGTLE